VLFEGEAKELIAETTTGEISILANHEPLVTVLKPSELVVVKEGGERSAVRIEGGFLEVRPGSEVIVLAKSAA
jgi:F-type H+-transporting ATPase subunit epsilon